ncbi:4Fe-4S dicluster domain-containing protein [Clostridium cadaveris]|uniref:Coenzyme F420 hydrogenase/dehydrogenase, beta subunit C-terminal domain n=1 Tax=Clostridium cadaveris TaxID=1529 RepID=UPI001459D8C5|nr:Coenzyme F420 hydrogenase/dehydrogenase, beta subunit C-terminal domain [Clostridium cadaveris]NME63974.1 4Fe-4S dicluster domain-containing protein [Clostridium cadaveris]
MLTDENIKRCFGCSACINICPKKCIKFDKNSKGFLYPKINASKCINCGICNKVCPTNHFEINDIASELYAYKNVNEIRQSSTSGGFFTLISDYILTLNGSIYGAAYSNEFEVKHIRAISKKQRNLECGSKYVQSYLGDIFKNIEEDLKLNLYVLFSGTPCQIAGLNNYLEERNICLEKLITCDIICHGVPSPEVWKSYVNYLEKIYKAKIVSVNFRYKKLGWHKPILYFKFSNGKEQLFTEKNDPFYQMFYSNCILRYSCYVCPFASKKRVGDFTMADCWGIEQKYPVLDDNRGISLVLVNNKKASTILENIKNMGEFLKIDFLDINQPHLEHPVAISRKYDKFWDEYNRKTFKYILNKYGNFSVYRKIVKKCKKIILFILRR